MTPEGNISVLVFLSRDPYLFDELVSGTDERVVMRHLDKVSVVC